MNRLTSFLVITLIFLVAVSFYRRAHQPPKEKPQTSTQIPEKSPENPVPTQAKIQVVFALDATGSMGGLIGAAKEKIWSIAGSLAQADPTPKIEIGLLFIEIEAMPL